jgi:hypothetical protein
MGRMQKGRQRIHVGCDFEINGTGVSAKGIIAWVCSRNRLAILSAFNPNPTCSLEGTHEELQAAR